jgi:asparagine synthase (glutamine-hydrolysing)
MCGICGVLDLRGHSFPVSDIEAMSEVLRHRGPDDHGIVFCNPMSFGFRRLSIVDLPGGKQPMSNEDGTIWIAFNGEIYNHRELRPGLERCGHRYSSNSDTETIVHAYEQYGPDCVRHLRGMFSFAIWDSRLMRLFCARDRLGIKPFYYALSDDRFLFSSEIKSLLRVEGFKAQLNRRAIPEFLSFGYLASDETMFEGVRKLMPGHRLTVDLRSRKPIPVIEQYWDLDHTPRDPYASEEECVEQFRALFADTVRSHLMGDVPVGVFLSGGLDSSSIAAEMAAQRREPVQSFSVGYADEQYSELPYARVMAEHIGAEHHEVVMGPDEFFAAVPEMIWSEDEPLAWPSSVSLFFVSRLARRRVKVVLTGEGADEIFAGYLKYRATMWNLRGGKAYSRYVPTPIRAALRRALSTQAGPDWVMRKLRHSFLHYGDCAGLEEIHFDNFYCAFSRSELQAMFAPALSAELAESDPYGSSMRFAPRGDSRGNLLNELLYLDIKTYLVELLMKQDQMSMAASIESRVPFLDHKLVEFAAGLPAKYKIRNCTGKYLLRRAMEERLPKQVIKRSKKGFPTPIRPWLRGPLFERLSEILTNGRLADRGLIDPAFVSQLLESHKRGSARATDGCWRLLNFELWHTIFIDGDSERSKPSDVTVDRLTACA